MILVVKVFVFNFPIMKFAYRFYDGQPKTTALIIAYRSIKAIKQ